MSSAANSPNAGRSQLAASRRNREIKVQHLDAPPQASPRSRSPSPHRSSHYNLYEKESETNLLNFVDFLSEEDVEVEREVLLVDAKFLGAGSTMEVYSSTWNGQQVAVKRMRRDKMPIRSANLPLENDMAYREASRMFYADVKSIMQEILVMSRVSENDIKIRCEKRV
jgi:hypothetical protein